MAGYQAQGTLGRILLDGATAVKIHGEDFPVKARIRSIDLYSGHADGPELHAWLSERLPIAQGLFLVHGEEEAMEGLRARVAGSMLPADRVIMPAMDETYELTPAGPQRLMAGPERRIAPEEVGKLDWHNDLSRLLLDINEAVENSADERGKRVVIRRLRRALSGDASQS
jgi:metallo-beta-lactamase family protein